MERTERQAPVAGPAAWFTGDVSIETVASAHPASPLNVAAVTFAPGARTAWHAHAGGQTLYVTDDEHGAWRES